MARICIQCVYIAVFSGAVTLVTNSAFLIKLKSPDPYLQHLDRSAHAS